MVEAATSSQPWMPKVRLLWLFALMTLSAVLIYVVQAADQGGMLAFATVATIGLVGLLSVLYMAFFFLAYSLGRFENSLNDPVVPSNPFADGQLPDQIVPPRPTTSE